MASNSLPPEALAAALSAAHGAGAKGAAAPTDPTAGAAPGPADPSQDPNAQGGGDPNQDPNEQAVWTEFPSTDPSAIQQVAQQAQGAAPQDLVAMLAQFMQQAQADQDKLSQMQESMLAQLTTLLGGPSGGGQDLGGGPPQAPGVGGQTSGY